MSTLRALGLLLALVAVCVHCDTYLHNPRGSNNRLNEQAANRNNGNRMFDSQNNNRGGYNKADLNTGAFGGNAPDGYTQQFDEEFYMSDINADETNGKSILTVEWTNQHGCGGNEHGDPAKLNCQIILQYQCVPEYQSNDQGSQDRTRASCNFECFVPIADNIACNLAVASPCPRVPLEQQACESANYLWLPAQVDDAFNCPHACTGIDSASDFIKGSQKTCELAGGQWNAGYAPRDYLLRDGLNTNRQEYTEPGNAETEATRQARKTSNNDYTRGLHESWEWYDECYRRERNRGIFTADQNLRDNALGYSSAVFTRQNPNNNRRGYECPEERDMYPYWHPTPWVDVAIMTDRLDMCPWYQEQSQNVKSKHLCRNTAACPRCVRFNNQAQCEGNQGRWVEVGAHNVPPPECIQAPWSRVNHLGNGRYGQANSYNWTLPHIAGGFKAPVTGLPLPDPLLTRQRCVFRLRYNISTDDYNGWMVNASFNENDGEGIFSPVEQNPEIDVGATATALRLAINTAQFGRTFQDRSHVFVLKPRESASVTRLRPKPADAPASFFHTADNTPRTVYNLNVRGKRGNIVQTFPSVEYDFIPNQLHVSDEDLIHFQWVGSNTHNNGNPAGDGQAGDAGEGLGGTDRHNVVELRRRHFDESFPATWEENTMFRSLLDAYAPTHKSYQGANPFTDYAALSGQTPTKSFTDAQLDWAIRMSSAGYYRDAASVKTKAKLQVLLDNAPASFHGGVFRFQKGEFNFMCTRNHNFSNRDQKGVIIVDNNVGDTLSVANPAPNKK